LSVKTKLSKLEQRAKQHYEVIRLPDGSEVRYSGDNALDALCATLDQGDHWLLPAIRQVETSTGLPGLIRALAGSKDLHQWEGAG
jgi:hypothetical protein